jgi:LemA protein
MQKKKYTGFWVGGFIVLIGIFMIVTYNALIKKEEVVKKQWSEIQNTYQRRIDLIPNLVNVVKGVSDFEQGTLEKIAEARSNALRGLSGSDLTGENYQNQKKLQDTLATVTNRLIIQIEKYPSLKGTEAYSGLQTQLEGTERRIKVARNDFNEAVNIYNKKVRSFPVNLVAGILGFKKKVGFESASGSDKSVEIKF